jgi:hypothetical protein
MVLVLSDRIHDAFFFLGYLHAVIQVQAMPFSPQWKGQQNGYSILLRTIQVFLKMSPDTQ